MHHLHDPGGSRIVCFISSTRLLDWICTYTDRSCTKYHNDRLGHRWSRWYIWCRDISDLWTVCLSVPVPPRKHTWARPRERRPLHFLVAHAGVVVPPRHDHGERHRASRSLQEVVDVVNHPFHHFFNERRVCLKRALHLSKSREISKMRHTRGRVGERRRGVYRIQVRGGAWGVY